MLNRRVRLQPLVLFALILGLLLSSSFVVAQEGRVIKIASQSPLSGGQSAVGVGIRNGVELAIQQLGGNLRAMGLQLQDVRYDDQASPDVGVAHAQQRRARPDTLADTEILAVIGHYNTGVAIPSSEVYNQNQLLMVSPANTGPAVTDRGLPIVNRVVGRDDLQGPTGAQFAASLEDVETVWVLHDTTAYGQGVAEFFRQEAEAQGLVVLGFEGTEERANFDGIIQPILALAPD